MFFVCRNLTLSPDRVRLLIYTVSVAGFCMLMACINQWLGLVKMNTPLLGLYSRDHGGGVNFLRFGEHRTVGTMGTIELLGEYSVLMIVLLIPLIVSRSSREIVGVRLYLLIGSVLSFVFCIIFSETRSSVILLSLVIVIYLTFFAVTRISSIDNRRALATLVIVGVIAVMSLWNVVGGDYVWNRLASLDLEHASLSDLASGERINRLETYAIGIERLHQRDWIFGFGSGVDESNRMAWFGSMNSQYVDFHSLYLALPMLYGWAGSAAFIVLILFTAGRCYWTVMKYRHETHFLTPLCLGLAFFWLFFLTNEYKISILRNANYQMLVWVWLGLSQAVVTTIESEIGDNAYDVGEEAA
jgi:hypothetical protein